MSLDGTDPELRLDLNRFDCMLFIEHWQSRFPSRSR